MGCERREKPRERGVRWGWGRFGGSMMVALAVGCAGGLGEEAEGDEGSAQTSGASEANAAPGSAPTARSNEPPGKPPPGGSASNPGGSADADPAGGTSSQPGVDSQAAGEPGDQNTGEGQLPPDDSNDSVTAELLAAHNVARSEVGGATPMQPLGWSDEAAALAQDWAETLVQSCPPSLRHRTENNPYGENIAMRGSRPLVNVFPGAEAVQGWVDEQACWTYGTIARTEACEPACIAALNSNGCGHYTQVVWAETTSVGCGYSACTDDAGITYEIWVCNYGPPGNVIGRTPY